MFLVQTSYGDQTYEVSTQFVHFKLSCFSHCLSIAFSRNFCYSSFGVSSALSAEEWAPADGSKWVEKDYSIDIEKMEKEASERMEEKIKELMGNIETVGKN